MEGNKVPKARIIFISGREPGYVRNAVILNGLRANGVDVIECTDTSKSYIGRYPKAVGKFLLRNKTDYDAIFIGFFSQPLVSIIRKLTPKTKPIIFDAFLSAYDTMCFDRKKFRPESLMGKYFYRLDKHSCEIADKVLLDTNAHIDYFVKTFGLVRRKFQRVFIGADDSIFYPMSVERDDDKFIVFWHGNFLPLSGLEYVIKAAKLLEPCSDIVFKIAGCGIMYDEIEKLIEKLGISNVELLGWIPHQKLPEQIAKADVCLGGHFSDIDKAKRVIAGKAFEAIAMKRAVIVGNNPANRELFTDKESALLVEMANADALADSIVELKEREKLRKRIAERGYKVFTEKCRPEVIGREVKGIIEEFSFSRDR
ncbi:MAG: glycosyltransferase [Methanocellales archaeon]|nr:glycosyltransferase [Methanocellales archaeon]MDD3291857.1 glycosyltransferase [Methanocellales archaeon]MDD5235500.1 glycosyltransferase [Methanocellales archaeon]MDD5485119.1 glycosyltransferase [Methanocellales archaeon]